ncbi:GspH/FimT family pseudopilin [Dokdonella soli]
MTQPMHRQVGSARATAHVRTSSGFGLIEWVVTIAIVAILAAIALPSYRQTIQNNRTATEADDFISAINVARGEATTRSRPVTLCPSANGTACNGDSNWSTNQWIVFTDYGVRGTVDDTDTVLRVWKAVNPQDVLVSNPAIQWISFDRAGSASTDNAAVTASATFTLRPQSCAANARVQRTITLTLLGRVSLTSGSCS